MKDAKRWLSTNHESLVANLGRLIAIPSISTDGSHQSEISASADVVCDLMRGAGLNDVQILRTGGSNPFCFGQWTGAPGKPTLLLYAHHDVQPEGPAADWISPPFELTRRKGRLFGRGTADDKGAIIAHLGAVASLLKTRGSLPVNVKVIIEGEEEIGSKHLLPFFNEYQDLIRSDAIVVCDTENIAAGLPCITYSLRGVVGLIVEVTSATSPRHSGFAGGFLADAAIALNVILSRLYSKGGKLPVPGIDRGVIPMTAEERRWLKQLPGDEKTWRKEFGVLDGVKFANTVHPYEQTWRKPSITVTAVEASSIKGRSNQVLNKATAAVSCRLAPGQKPKQVIEALTKFLTKDPPWGVHVKITAGGGTAPWITDPNGPAFTAARAAAEAGFGRTPALVGCGGSIGFVGPLADELLGGAPALLLGIEDPLSKAHAPNESLHEGDLKKLTLTIAHLMENLGKTGQPLTAARAGRGVSKGRRLQKSV